MMRGDDYYIRYRYKNIIKPETMMVYVMNSHRNSNPIGTIPSSEYSSK